MKITQALVEERIKQLKREYEFHAGKPFDHENGTLQLKIYRISWPGVEAELDAADAYFSIRELQRLLEGGK